MADQQTQNTSIVEEKKVPPTDEVEEEPVPKVESPVPPVAKSRAPELTESPEMVASLAVELTTAKTEVDALVGAITESSTRLENVDGQEGTSQLIKVMLLGLKAQRSISQIGSIEMKQVAAKQLDLLRHVAAGFSDQTEILQTLSDDIGANLNGLAQSFVKLSDVIKEGYKQSKDGGTDTENRHRQMLRNSTPKMCISCTSGMASIRLSSPALICSGLQRSCEQEEKKENQERSAARVAA